jgi:hypothetical protein
VGYQGVKGTRENTCEKYLSGVLRSPAYWCFCGLVVLLVAHTSSNLTQRLQARVWPCTMFILFSLSSLCV